MNTKTIGSRLRPGIAVEVAFALTQFDRLPKETKRETIRRLRYYRLNSDKVKSEIQAILQTCFDDAEDGVTKFTNEWFGTSFAEYIIVNVPYKIELLRNYMIKNLPRGRSFQIPHPPK